MFKVVYNQLLYFYILLDKLCYFLIKGKRNESSYISKVQYSSILLTSTTVF